MFFFTLFDHMVVSSFLDSFTYLFFFTLSDRMIVSSFLTLCTFFLDSLAVGGCSLDRSLRQLLGLEHSVGGHPLPCGYADKLPPCTVHH